jgi:hypothetical protein
MKRAAILVAFFALPGAARADVTVYFGAPVPPEGSTVIPERVEPDTREVITPDPSPADPEPATSSPASVSSEEPTPSAPEPAAVDRPIEPSATEAAPPTEAAALPAEPRCSTPVEIVRVGDGSGEHAALSLLDCSGHADSTSLRELSLLGRPSRVARPSTAMLEAHEADTNWVGPRIRRLHAGLLDRLRAIADHFPGHVIEIVSAYRPDARDGSRHRLGRAIDLRVRDVAVSELDAFLRTIEGTGVGLYPTTDFVHVDVRSRSAHWIDVSGPGEAPSLVREEAATPAEATTSESEEPAEVDGAAIGEAAAALLDGFAIELR